MISRIHLERSTFIFRFVEFNKIDRKQICKRYLHDYLHGCNHLGDFTSKFIDANISRIKGNFFLSAKAPPSFIPQIDFLRDIGDGKRTFAEFRADYARYIYMYNVEK